MLAGIGHVGPQQKKNFLIVDPSGYYSIPEEEETSPTNIRCAETQISTIEAAFADFTSRKDIAILLINQHVSSITRFRSRWPVTNLLLTPEQIAEKIRPTVDRYQQAFPALLEIPSKDHPYGMFALFGGLVTDYILS